MKAKRIAIASVLKPVDEPRMFHKIGLSLSKAGYDVHIAGYGKKIISKEFNLYPLFSFRRLSFKRLTAPVSIYLWLKKIKPDLVIITTHELLLAASFYKIFHKSKVIYDVQENYFLNIIRTTAFPKILRWPIAACVRIIERFFSGFTDHFFLAERGYERELKFIKNRYTILENKAVIYEDKTEKKSSEKTGSREDKLQLIFTGTITESSGIFQCVEMAKKLHDHEPKIRLTIAGYCQLPEALLKLKKLVEKNPWIKLIGGADPVDYNIITTLFQSADAAFVFYPDQLLVHNKIPTKFYEYLAYRIPILLQPKKEWLELAQVYTAAIPINPENFQHKHILNMIKKGDFYKKKPGNEVLWGSEAEKMVKIVDHLLQ